MKGVPLVSYLMKFLLVSCPFLTGLYVLFLWICENSLCSLETSPLSIPSIFCFSACHFAPTMVSFDEQKILSLKQSHEFFLLWLGLFVSYLRNPSLSHGLEHDFLYYLVKALQFFLLYLGPFHLESTIVYEVK